MRSEIRYDFNDASRPYANRHGLFAVATDLIIRGARYGLRGLLREGEAAAEPEATGYSSEIKYFAGSRLGRSLAHPCRLQTMSCTRSYVGR